MCRWLYLRYMRSFSSWGDVSISWLLVITTWTFMDTLLIFHMGLGRRTIWRRLKIVSFKLILIIIVSISVNWVMLNRSSILRSVWLGCGLSFIGAFSIKLWSNRISLRRWQRWHLLLISYGTLRYDTSSVFINASLTLRGSGSYLNWNIVVRIVSFWTSLFSAFEVRTDTDLLARHSTIWLASLLTCSLFLLCRELCLLRYIHRWNDVIDGWVYYVFGFLRNLLLFNLWEHVSSIVGFPASLFLF